MADRYFSSNPEGGVVSRFGTGSSTRTNTLIGAYRDPKDPRRIEYTDEVVAIPEAEFLRFRREYARAVRDKSLIERSADDYRAFLAKQAKDTEGEAVEGDANDGTGGDAPAAEGDSPAPKGRRKGSNK